MPGISLSDGQQQRLCIARHCGYASERPEGDLIEVQVRRALIGYVLQRLAVDTTADHSMNPNAHQLIVLNRDEIEPFAGWAFL